MIPIQLPGRTQEVKALGADVYSCQTSGFCMSASISRLHNREYVFLTSISDVFVRVICDVKRLGGVLMIAKFPSTSETVDRM